MFFLQYMKLSDSTNERTTNRYENMTVNPNLATLMRVIEDQQDKMPEGEYLEAMNALGALHRIAPAPPLAAAAQAGPPPSYAASVPLFQQPQLPHGMDRVEQDAWYRVSREHPEYFGISVDDWIELSEEERNDAIRGATEMVVNQLERRYKNPEPEECPFIARHAVGGWRVGAHEHQWWECVCGYTGKTKNWQKHEQSERHQDWAKHRTVSRRKIANMKKEVERDERGDVCRYKPQSRTEFGGIRYFQVNQERNEWTHPELYADPVHRNPIPTAVGSLLSKWFVHPRIQRHNSREYVE